MSERSYNDWTVEEGLSFFSDIEVDGDSKVIKPSSFELPFCPVCGNRAKGLYESEPSTAKYNEDAVHFRVKCSDESCEKEKVNLWDILPLEALQTFINKKDV